MSNAIPATVANSLTEEQFQRQVIDLAKLSGFLVYHTRDSRRSEPGFPDLIMVRDELLVIAELKAESGQLTPAQRGWLQRLGTLEAVAPEWIIVRCWKPSDWPEIEAALTTRASPEAPR